MKSIPVMQTESREVNQLQQFITSAITPLLTNAFLSGSLVTNVQLKLGSNVINHGLGKQLQGWSIVRKRGPGDISDNQDSNQTPAKTLILVSTTAVSVNIYCF